MQDETMDATYDVTTFVPPAEGQSRALRMLGWVMVIGGAVALALVLIGPKLRSAPVAQHAAVPAPPALPSAQPAAPAQEASSAQVEPPQSSTKGRRAKRAAAAAPAAEASVTTIRIRASIAPVRAAPEADAKVVCSVKRGAVMRSSQQTPSGKARWFAVQCDKDSPGWVHENFVKAM
jgi:hypothetical protein